MPTLKLAFGNKKLLPYSDILTGKVTENSFAAGFHSVITGNADEIYNNPEKYFKLTHFTNNIKNIFGDALERLSEGGARPLLVIDTTFGGGKTHTLVGLYHLFQHSREAKENTAIKRIMDDVGISEIPSISLVAIDGHNVSSVKKSGSARTIWGHIGKQLGCYELIESFDQELRKPDSDTISDMLKSTGKPVLIMIDELVNHLKDSQAEVVGGTNLAEITISFFHTLTDVIVNSENAMLVVTLPGAEASYQKESEMLEEYKTKVKDIAGREASFTVPMEKSEIYEVIKKRLFENVDETHARQVAETLQKFYASHSDQFPEDVTKPQYYEKIVKSYPFHPSLIDILYERVATITDFQKTRGVLRLLTHVLKDVYQHIDEIPDDLVITPGIVNLNNGSIFQELTNKISRGEYQSVISTDIVNDEAEAKCQKLDGTSSFGHHVRIATSIYLYTLIGSVKDSSVGCSKKELVLATAMSNVVYPKDIGNAISELDEELWYIYSRTSKWFFGVEVNINKVISDETDRVIKEDYDPEIKKRLRKLLEAEDYFYVYTWDHDVRNPHKPTLVAVNYNEIKCNESEVPAGVQEIIEKEGTTFRSKKNLMFVLAPRSDRVSKMTEAARKYLAIKNLKTAVKTRKELAAYNTKLETSLKESESNLNSSIELCYSLIYYPQKTDVKVITVQNGYTGAKNLPDKVYLALSDKARKIVETLNPEYIVEKIISSKPEITVGEIYSAFEEAPSNPLPKNKVVINNSIVNGIIDKNFGLYIGSIADLTAISESNYSHVGSNFYYGRKPASEPREGNYVIPKARAYDIESKLNELTAKSKKETVKDSYGNGDETDATDTTDTISREGKGSKYIAITDLDEVSKYKGKNINYVNFKFSSPVIFSQIENKVSIMLLGKSNVKSVARISSDKLKLSFEESEVRDLNKLTSALSKICELFPENLNVNFKLMFYDDFEISEESIDDFTGLKPLSDQIDFEIGITA